MIKKTFLFLVALLLIPKPGLAQPSELQGLHYTPEEVAIWQDRAENGPYKSDGDVSTDSPGDWDRIVQNKDDFMADPSSDLWPGWDEDGCIYATADLDHPEINGRFYGYDTRDAAFYSLVMDDSTVRDEVYDFLIDQINEPGADFSDESKWCLDEGDRVNDIGTAFWLATWATRILFAYDYIRPWLSEAEKAPIEEWLSDAAHYFRINSDDKLATDNYSDWENGVLNSGGQSRANDYGSDGRTHIGGEYIVALGRWFNNRRAHQMRFYGLAGILLDESTAKTWAKRWAKEYLKYHVYPDTALNELHRSHGSNAAQGWQYSFETFSAVAGIADAFARQGDRELYEYTTSDGGGPTAGGPKTIKFPADFFRATSEGDWLIYNWDTSESVENLIDGVWYPENYYAFLGWLAQYNLYWQDQDIRDAYDPDHAPRNKHGTSSSREPGRDVMGGGQVYSGKLFMWGQLEGEVDPYGGGSSGGNDTNEPPTADFTFQVSSLTVEFSDQSSDPDGSIASWDWSFGDGSTSDTQNLSHTYDTDGTYTVTLFVTDDQGASDSVTQDVTVGSSDDGGDLPEDWANRDVGSTEVAGSASCSDDGNAFTVEGGGEDIWGEADAFHFSHRKLEGDGVVTAHVTAQEATDPWAKAGVMIRESLSSDAKHAMTVVTPENGTAFQRRTQTSESSDHTTASETGSWVRVERNGDTLVGLTSHDGTNWTEIDRVTIEMQEEVYVGLAVTSHEEGELSTARLEDVEVEADNADDGTDTDPEPEPYEPPGDNLATGATHIDDSGNFHADSPVDGFWDGDISGEPEASPGNAVDQVWVEYDLGKAHELSEVRLFGDDDGDWVSESFSVEAKRGRGQSYTTVINAANARGDQWFTQELNDVKARYVRLTVTGDPHTQAREFEVYGTPVNSSDSNSLTSLTFDVSQNHPNPFSGSTLISYQLPEAAEVSIEVFDMLGRHMATLVNDWQDAGRHEVVFEGESLPSGTYLYRVQVGKHTETKQMVVVK